MSCPSVTLSNGVCMPILGLGTSHQGGYNHDTVREAIDVIGYRHIDTAQRYKSEEGIGLAVKQSEIVQRSDMFLTTKLWPDHYGKNDCLKHAKQSLSILDTDYIDLFLLHWPASFNSHSVEDTWRGMELLLESDKVRAIGVSNFEERHLERLLDVASVVPHVNQIEFHPYQQNWALARYCLENKIQVEGYSPLGKGAVLGDKNVLQIAKELQVTPSQVLIRWSVQNRVVTIPKSTKKDRVNENWNIWQFHLSDAHMKTLNGLHRDMKVTWDSSSVP